LLLGLLVLPVATEASFRIYVTREGLVPVPGSVAVFDTLNNQMVGQPIPVGDAPTAIATTPDRTRVYVTNTDNGTVSLVSTATTIPVGAPAGIAVTPDGAYAYVTNQDSDSVSVIATATNQVVATVLLARAVPPEG
jgi:YVTN family beta-propeller protein